jgi:glycerophosphoryl diester phosphodiesterase
VSQGPITVTSERTLRLAREAGVPVHVWTIDHPGEIQRLVDLGVHGIMTDEPAVLRTVCEHNGLWSIT